MICVHGCAALRAGGNYLDRAHRRVVPHEAIVDPFAGNRAHDASPSSSGRHRSPCYSLDLVLCTTSARFPSLQCCCHAQVQTWAAPTALLRRRALWARLVAAHLVLWRSLLVWRPGFCQCARLAQPRSAQGGIGSVLIAFPLLICSSLSPACGSMVFASPLGLAVAHQWNVCSGQSSLLGRAKAAHVRIDPTCVPYRLPSRKQAVMELRGQKECSSWRLPAGPIISAFLPVGPISSGLPASIY